MTDDIYTRAIMPALESLSKYSLRSRAGFKWYFLLYRLISEDLRMPCVRFRVSSGC